MGEKTESQEQWNEVFQKAPPITRMFHPQKKGPRV